MFFGTQTFTVQDLLWPKTSTRNAQPEFTKLVACFPSYNSHRKRRRNKRRVGTWTCERQVTYWGENKTGGMLSNEKSDSRSEILKEQDSLGQKSKLSSIAQVFCGEYRQDRNRSAGQLDNVAHLWLARSYGLRRREYKIWPLKSQVALLPPSSTLNFQSKYSNVFDTEIVW